MRKWIALFEKTTELPDLIGQLKEQTPAPYDDDPTFNLLIPDNVRFYDVYGEIEHDFNTFFCTREEQQQFRDLFKKGNYLNYTEHRTIQHSDLVTGQRWVSREGVEQYLAAPGGPLVIWHYNIDGDGSTNLLMDGNHRLVADILKGKTESECLVLDVAPLMDSEGYVYGSQHPEVIAGTAELFSTRLVDRR